MILDIFDSYSEIITKYEIVKFKIVGVSYQLICRIDFLDESQLYVRDYLFLDGSKKYSFHWQDINSNCIVRWDNAPHYQDVATFPHHKHIGKEECVEESQPMKIETVLEHIRSHL